MIKIKLEFLIKQQAHHVTMLDKGSFGFPGGAGSIDNVGQVGGANLAG